MRTILHIGLHKTGTSAIQAFCAAHVGALEKRGVYYRVAPPATNHSGIADGILRGGAARETAIARLRRYIDAAERQGSRVALISSEMFADVHPRLLDGALPGELTVLVYIRRPDDQVVSAYSQIIRDGKTRFSGSRAEGIKTAYDPTYRALLGPWIEHFGQAVVIAPYDRRQWQSGSLIADFLAMVGVSRFPLLKGTVDRGLINQSLPLPYVDVMRRLNRFPRSMAEHEALVARLYAKWRARGSPEGPPLLTDDQRAGLLAALAPHLDFYRPHFRPGFDDGFLRGLPAKHREDLTTRQRPFLFLRRLIPSRQ